MPYTSKAKIERSRWTDFATAVARVIAVDGCNEEQALRDIEAAIRDRKIPWRWEDQAQPPFGSTGPIGWVPPISDILPDKFEVDQQMRLKDEEGRFRKFLLSKFSFERLFEHQKNVPQPAMELRKANDSEILEAIKEVYDDAEAKRIKPPNIKELAALVQQRLEKKGYWASQLHIQTLAGAAEFKSRRRPPGKTVSSERRARRK
jgi:hypothetical protein